MESNMIKKTDGSLFDTLGDRTDSINLTLQDFLVRYRKLLRPLIDIHKLRHTDPTAISKFAKSLVNLPSATDLAKALEEMRESGQALIRQEQTKRTESFRKILTSYVNEMKKKISIKEISGGWRVGKLELHVKQERSEVRIAYLREWLTPRQEILTLPQLQKTYDNGVSRLEEYAIPESVLPDLFWEAYNEVRAKKASHQSALKRVLLRDYYEELRITLFRFQLRKSSPDKDLKFASFPKFAFLYNMDRYIALGSRVPNGKRISLETGSQQDVKNRKGMLFNGLDARQEYKTFCFVKTQRLVMT